MTHSILIITAWLVIIGCGVMAGVYFAFSVFVMRAFDQLPAKQAIAAMNSINVVIVKSLFLPVFFGSTVLALVLLVFSLIGLQGMALYLGAGAGSIYLVSMFLCTAMFNVPLNNRLAVFDPHQDDAGRAWASYRKRWTQWNHLRTVGSLLSMIMTAGLLMSV